MLVVVETPDSVRSCRLEEVCQLNLTHEHHVALENFVDRCTEIVRGKDSHLKEAEEESDKVELVPRSVINSLVVTERFLPVDFDFRDAIFEPRS